MFEQDIRLGPGTGTTTSHTLEIFIMLAVAALLGLWLGWILWSRYRQEAEKLRLDNASLNATAETLRIELAAGKTNLHAAEADNSNFAAQVASLNRNNANLRDRVAELEDLLSVTEARNRTVETELGLSYTPDAAISDDFPLEITSNLHESTEVSDGGGWVEVPLVVAIDPDPETDALLPTQPLQGSVTVEVAEPPVAEIVIEEPVVPVVVEETPASAEASADTPTPIVATKTRTPKAKAAAATTSESVVPVAAASEPDDLTVVEGIGPKIQMLLNQYGIYTYHELADTEVNRLKEILQSAGPQLAMHDPGTWPSQANLAANDQWDALKSIQGFLKGGKKPT